MYNPRGHDAFSPPSLPKPHVSPCPCKRHFLYHRRGRTIPMPHHPGRCEISPARRHPWIYPRPSTGCPFSGAGGLDNTVSSPCDLATTSDVHCSFTLMRPAVRDRAVSTRHHASLARFCCVVVGNVVASLWAWPQHIRITGVEGPSGSALLCCVPLLVMLLLLSGHGRKHIRITGVEGPSGSALVPHRNRGFRWAALARELPQVSEVCRLDAPVPLCFLSTPTRPSGVDVTPLPPPLPSASLRFLHSRNTGGIWAGQGRRGWTKLVLPRLSSSLACLAGAACDGGEPGGPSPR